MSKYESPKVTELGEVADVTRTGRVSPPGNPPKKGGRDWDWSWDDDDGGWDWDDDDDGWWDW